MPQAPSDFVLVDNHGDGVLRNLLPQDRYQLLPEPYRPHKQLLREAELISEPSAVMPCLCSSVCFPQVHLQQQGCGPACNSASMRLSEAPVISFLLGSWGLGRAAAEVRMLECSAQATLLPQGGHMTMRERGRAGAHTTLH